MVFALRRRAGKVSLTLTHALMMAITISVLVLFDPTHGQPNYYFKASAPAVKSLPRIGRRSDDGGINDGSGFPKTMDVPGGILVWQTGSNNGGSPQDSFVSSGNSGGRSSQSLIAPIPSPSSQNNIQLNKAILWRKLFGDGGSSSYDDIVFDSLYTAKT